MVSFYHHLGYFCICFFRFWMSVFHCNCLLKPKIFQLQDLGKGLSRVVFDLVWYLVRTSFWPRSWPAFVWSFFSMFSLLDMQNRSKTACKHILAAKTNFNLTMVPALAFPWCLASQLPFLDIFKSCLWHWVFTYELYPTYPSSTRVSIVTCTQNICAKHALDIYLSPSGHAKQNNKDPKTHCIPYAFPWWNHKNAMT